ncbi:hypothetical protein V8C35DRAFT_290423 [Trichoderma chlorosporum]
MLSPMEWRHPSMLTLAAWLGMKTRLSAVKATPPSRTMQTRKSRACVVSDNRQPVRLAYHAQHGDWSRGGKRANNIQGISIGGVDNRNPQDSHMMLDNERDEMAYIYPLHQSAQTWGPFDDGINGT